MAIPSNKTRLQVYQLDFGHFHFFSNYVTSSINEGVNLDTEKLEQFYTLCRTVFGDQAFCVIELRESSFSLDPTFYWEYEELLKNVACHSLVIDPESDQSLGQFEATYIKHCPFQIFDTLSEAIRWSDRLVQTQRA